MSPRTEKVRDIYDTDKMFSRDAHWLTLADMSREEGSSHPRLLVVSGTTAVTALAARVVLTLAAEFLAPVRKGLKVITAKDTTESGPFAIKQR